MDSAGTSNACTTNIKFYESLSDEVIEEVCSFLSKEADWNQVPFDLKVANCFAIVRSTEGTIIGFSTTNILSPRNLWLGNVCVAKSTRKTGLASAIVKAILDRASKQRLRCQMVLLASPLGEGVYRRVGFTNVKDIGVSYRQRLAQPPPTTTTITAWIPTALEHEDAILLEEEIGGSFRGEFLRMLFEKDHLCAVAKTGSNIAAVAWGRYKGQTPSTGEVNLHVGPVVARTPDLAKSVVAEILRMDAASHSGHSASCSRATVLSMRIRGNETGQRMFQSLGFEKVFDPPYMQKAVADESNSSPSGVDLACADADYYATTWWDMG